MCIWEKIPRDRREEQGKHEAHLRVLSAIGSRGSIPPEPPGLYSMSPRLVCPSDRRWAFSPWWRVAARRVNPHSHIPGCICCQAERGPTWNTLRKRMPWSRPLQDSTQMPFVSCAPTQLWAVNMGCSWLTAAPSPENSPQLLGAISLDVGQPTANGQLKWGPPGKLTQWCSLCSRAFPVGQAKSTLPLRPHPASLPQEITAPISNNRLRLCFWGTQKENVAYNQEKKSNEIDSDKDNQISWQDFKIAIKNVFKILKEK